MIDGQGLEFLGLVSLVGDGDAAPLDDARLVASVEALERAKAACAAAQARLTARFVASQATEAQRLRQVAQECSEAGDFDGWVAARDRARAMELPCHPAPGGDGGRGGSSGSQRRRAAAVAARTGVSAQVGLARHESPARGARLARVAVTLVEDLPHTLAALTAGHLSERRAELVATGTSHLSRELRVAVDAEVIGANLPAEGDPAATGLAGWGDREVERRVRACADRLDAAAAVERARVAESERRVTIRPIPDTMAIVSAVLPVAQAVAVNAALQQAAATAKAAGDERSRGQVMADTLVERVTGRASADDVDVEVQVVITDRALFAGDDPPAHVPGHGPVPAGWVRDLLTRDLLRQDQVTPGPAPFGRDGSARDVAGADRARRAGPASNRAGPDVAGADRARRAGPASNRAERDGPGVARVWLRRLYTHPGTGTLVAMESTRRLFPAGLRRYLVARDGVCRTPWCDAPVRHADHVRPHALGGPTSADNGQGLCVACNLTKDLPGWASRLVDPGPTAGSSNPHTVQLTTPTGHAYVSTAPPLLPGLIEPAASSRLEMSLSPLEGSLSERLAA
ncbi:MAG TPA: DUF222 domain-containing protein [Intrasporangium sp.]|nr:DUF222 domain-containing protein [Intrasporangium sp.]